ncbi:MAG: dihydrolipoyllysine-residue acetyltransferase, partial [Acidobacteria bacterium]
MTEFKLPELGENIDQGDLVRLMIAPGKKVSEGEPVMELETDKAVVEVPSSVSGVVKDVRVKEGDKLKVGQVIFTVENGAGAKSKPAPPQPAVEQKAERVEAKSESARARTEPEAAPSSTERRTRSTDKPLTTGATEFRLPELGENIDQGDLVRLMIAPGAKVSEGQPVMELETDKAVVEVPSSVTGVVKEVKVKEGDKLQVGQIIFTLEGAVSQAAQRPKAAPIEHVSGQHGARLAFQAAIRAEGKTEE